MAAHEGQLLNSRLDTQAADWLARLQRDDVTAAERAELERWLAADPAHAVAFARTEFAWERAERLRAVPESTRAGWFAHPMRGRVRELAIAATLVALTFGLVLSYFAFRSNSYTTDLGERRAVALEDGSQVNLNTSSRIKVDFDKQTRTVRLVQGEALFKVTPDPQRPFVVRAGDTFVRAVGTAFNVRMQNQVVEVTVTEGAVAVNDDSQINAGSAVVAAAGGVKRVAMSEDAIKRRVAWREGVIELKGETLERAVEEFNRYRRAKIVVADPAIAALRVGGRFETDEAEKFIKALEANFAIRAREGEEGSIYLLGSEADITAPRPQ